MKKIELDITAYQVAKEYWGLPPNERTFGRVCELLNIQSGDTSQKIRNQNYLSQLTRAHEIAGLVKHKVLPARAPGFADHATEYAPLLPELEDRLRRRFGLRDVIVVDTSDFRPVHGDWLFKHDDLLHEHLGRWAGRILASTVRPDDVVATGGGRGPYYCAHFCAIPPHSTYPKKVVSLTGSISAGMWRGASDITDDNATRDVDADRIASLLHSKLGTKQTPEYLNCTIVDGKEGSNAKHDGPNSKDVNVAVVGIGALGGGHRLKQEDILDDLKQVKNLVKDLNREVTAVEKHFQDKDPKEPYFHCIGDVCNSYFVLEEVKNAPDGEHIYKRLTDRVAEINSHFVNTQPEELNRICRKGVVMAVAGGPHKTGAIAHVLRQNEKGSPWITHLVTSDEVAKSILQNFG